jgi:hypothetical protein
MQQINMKDIPVPILMAHGERSNHLNRRNKMVFREPENLDKKLNLYPALCHELHNKQGREKVLSEQDPGGNSCQKLNVYSNRIPCASGSSVP